MRSIHALQISLTHTHMALSWCNHTLNSLSTGLQLLTSLYWLSSYSKVGLNLCFCLSCIHLINIKFNLFFLNNKYLAIFGKTQMVIWLKHEDQRIVCASDRQCVGFPCFIPSLEFFILHTCHFQFMFCNTYLVCFPF